MTTHDGTMTCAHEGCECRVADTQSHPSKDGALFCSDECRDGRGCHCGGCDCGGSDASEQTQ